jgi:hypothetical protein
MKEVMFESWVPKALIDVTVEKMPQMFGGSSFEEQITFQRVQLKNFKYIHPAVNAPSFGGDVFTFVDSKSFRKFLEKRYSGKVRVHPMINVYDGVHVDTTFSAIGFNKKLSVFASSG